MERVDSWAGRQQPCAASAASARYAVCEVRQRRAAPARCLGGYMAPKAARGSNNCRRAPDQDQVLPAAVGRLPGREVGAALGGHLQGQCGGGTGKDSEHVVGKGSGGPAASKRTCGCCACDCSGADETGCTQADQYIMRRTGEPTGRLTVLPQVGRWERTTPGGQVRSCRGGWRERGSGQVSGSSAGPLRGTSALSSKPHHGLTHAHTVATHAITQ